MYLTSELGFDELEVGSRHGGPGLETLDALVLILEHPLPLVAR